MPSERNPADLLRALADLAELVEKSLALLERLETVEMVPLEAEYGPGQCPICSAELKFKRWRLVQGHSPECSIAMYRARADAALSALAEALDAE